MEVDLSLNFTWSGNLWSHDQRGMENDIISHWHHFQSCDFPCFPAPFLVCSQSEVIWNKLKAVEVGLCLWFDHFLWPALALASYRDHLHGQVSIYRTTRARSNWGQTIISLMLGFLTTSITALLPIYWATSKMQATYIVQYALPLCMTM